jgi:hypothetical protein
VAFPVGPEVFLGAYDLGEDVEDEGWWEAIRGVRVLEK